MRQPKPLGPLEHQVMDILWDGGAKTVRQVIDALPTDPAYTTVATVLGNLKKKQFVRTNRDGHATFYTATLTRADHDAALMGGVLEASQDRTATILRFAETMSDADLALLREHLREK